MGFSIVSMIEIMYYFTIRLLIEAYQKSKSKKKNDNINGENEPKPVNSQQNGVTFRNRNAPAMRNSIFYRYIVQSSDFQL